MLFSSCFVTKESLMGNGMEYMCVSYSEEVCVAHM